MSMTATRTFWRVALAALFLAIQTHATEFMGHQGRGHGKGPGHGHGPGHGRGAGCSGKGELGAMENVERTVTNTDTGVIIEITSDDPALVETIQNHVTQFVGSEA